YAAEPPNISSRSPKGVLTASNATEPTASIDIKCSLNLVESRRSKVENQMVDPELRPLTFSLRRSVFVFDFRHSFDPFLGLFCEVAFGELLDEPLVALCRFGLVVEFEVGFAEKKVDFIHL